MSVMASEPQKASVGEGFRITETDLDGNTVSRPCPAWYAEAIMMITLGLPDPYLDDDDEGDDA
jgi:hypothetical protein